jgi:large subunit ribosomal protein L7/L12
MEFSVMLVAIPVALVLGSLAFGLARRRGDRDLIAPPRDLGATAAAAPARTVPPAAPGGPMSLPPEVEAEVRALIAQGMKINAIKRVREVTRSGLKEAMDFVEQM